MTDLYVVVDVGGNPLLVTDRTTAVGTVETLNDMGDQAVVYKCVPMRMTPAEYTEAIAFFARQDMPGSFTELGVKAINYALGLAGESGEVCDELKKVLFHDKPLNEKTILKECGDVLWYLTRLLVSLGYSLEDCMELNVNKLRSRYPEGFDKAEQKFGFKEG